MRFSTSSPAFFIHDTSSNFKKVFSTIAKKLPHNQKVAPVTVKNDKNTIIKVVAKSSAISKEDDVYRNLRSYYSDTSRKRQLAVDDEDRKKNVERETRHKAVKQYQQSAQTKKSSSSTTNYHWKERSTMSNNHINSAAPLKFQTHDYIRDTRSNPNFLRIQAISSHSPSKIIVNNQKQYLKKRQDDFVWGKPSKLRDEIMN